MKEEFKKIINQLISLGATRADIQQIINLAGERSESGTKFYENALPLANELLKQFQGQQNAQDLSALTSERYESLSDPNSVFFQTFQKNLQRQIGSALEASTPTTSSLLALSLSRGLGYKSAANIAQQQRQGVEAQNRDVASRAAQQGAGELFLNLQGQAGQALGSLAQQSQFGQNLVFQQQQLAEQRRQFDESQPSFFDQILGAGLQIGGYALGNAIGGTSSSGGSTMGGSLAPTAQQGSNYNPVTGRYF